MLTIASPNTDRSLLTIEQLRVAAGLESTDNSKDVTLVPLGNYISASITTACKVAKSGVIPPTLRLETVTDTFLFKSLQRSLVLSRRPVVEIISVTQANSVLSPDDYTVDAASGVLYRSTLGCFEPYLCWSCGNTVVEYSAGYAVVPDDLVYAAIKYVQSEVTTGARDPALKRLRIEGVSEREWWVSDKPVVSSVPTEVMDILVRGGYVNVGFA